MYLQQIATVISYLCDVEHIFLEWNIGGVGGGESARWKNINTVLV